MSWQETEDWHTAGEPFRVVSKLPPNCLEPNVSVAEQRRCIIVDPDHPLDKLRQSLCHEPRGHADMYGGFLVPPNDAGAHLGVLFWHKDGFSTTCGHGTIALAYYALYNGVVKLPDSGVVDVIIDVPSGRVVGHATCQTGRVLHVDFVNVESYQVKANLPLTIAMSQHTHDIKVDLAFSGAIHAYVDAAQLDLSIEPRNAQRFIDLQRAIKAQLKDFRHQDEYDVYGVCFYQVIDDGETEYVQKNVMVFADGQIDRSPCGSGTTARMAILHAQGKLTASKKLINHSIIDTVFEGQIEKAVSGSREFPVCVPRVRGTASLVGRMKFFIDPDDQPYPGFLLR